MRLEAVWLKNGKEVYRVNPVVNVVCYEDMEDISDIEVFDGREWYSSEDINGGADDFIIRVQKEKE